MRFEGYVTNNFMQGLILTTVMAPEKQDFNAGVDIKLRQSLER